MIRIRHAAIVLVVLFLALPVVVLGQTTAPLPPIPTIPATNPTAPQPTPADQEPMTPIPAIPEQPAPVPPPAEPTVEQETGPAPNLPPLEAPSAQTPIRPGYVPVTVQANRYVFSPSQGIFQFFGDVELRERDVLIKADEATYTDATKTVIARGIVSIQMGDRPPLWGNTLEYNVTTRGWRFLNYTAEYPAAFLGPGFVAPVFINGRELSGLPSGVRASEAHVTTCNLADPHYEVVSDRVEIYPGDKLIAYDNDFYVLGHRVLHIPYFFLTLRQNRSPIVPEIGRNDYEGYYARFLYQYVLNPDQLGGVRLDLTEKRGIGLGIDHFYTVPRGSGEAFAYEREGFGEYLLRVDHTQKLPGQVDATVRLDTRQNSQFTLQPTTLTDVNTLLRRATAHTSTALSITRRLNEGTFSTDSVTSNLQYTSSVAAGNLRVSEEYSSFGRTSATGDTPADQELWSRLNWDHPLGFGTLNIRTDQRTDVDGDSFTGDNSFSGLQRLPEVTLTASQDDLDLNFLKSRLPSTFTLGWGTFDEFSAGNEQKLDRYQLGWRASLLNLLPAGSKTSLTGSASFLQTVYGDADTTAQYRYNANLTATTKFGPLTNVSRYGRQDKDGFTPFRFDTVYPYHTVTDSLQFLTPRVNATLTTGRDLEVGRWQDLTFRSTAKLSDRLSTNQSVAYDLNTDNWRDLVSQFSWRSDLLTVNASSLFDMNNQKLRKVSTELGWQAGPFWSIEMRNSYSLESRQFLYNEFLITRDLHCWDAALYVSTEQKTYGLFVRLKALNIPLPRFGIGRGGQVLDTSQGQPL